MIINKLFFQAFGEQGGAAAALLAPTHISNSVFLDNYSERVWSESEQNSPLYTPHERIPSVSQFRSTRRGSRPVWHCPYRVDLKNITITTVFTCYHRHNYPQWIGFAASAFLYTARLGRHICFELQPIQRPPILYVISSVPFYYRTLQNCCLRKSHLALEFSF